MRLYGKWMGNTAVYLNESYILIFLTHLCKVFEWSLTDHSYVKEYKFQFQNGCLNMTDRPYKSTTA